MKLLLENSRYLVLIGVITSLIAAIAAFVWGIVKGAGIISSMVTTSGKDPLLAGAFVELLDAFLIAAALYIFAVALYELFIADLNLPTWLVIHNLDELKGMLVNVVILVMGITFLEHLIEWQHAEETLLFGLGIAAVSVVLILFKRNH
jgi:uncharacterized membrane protein YqhA